MRKRISALWAALLVLANVPSDSSAATVRLDSGLVEGVSDDDIAIYKGIPFAAAPVGDLRWRAPQPLPVWRGVYKASEFKPQCMQLGPPFPTMPEEPTSEDCLFLNVWAPARASAAKRAVMVYIYGGNFRKGSPSTPLYWGDELARNNDVVVINISYRVGPLGFLVHPDLTAESAQRASGNYGLMDMIAALQWVQRNAAAFGGDPNNVTVFGQSAGAWAVNKLMISPLARGLFHKAIAQSGGDMGPTRTPEGMAILADAEKSGVAFAQSFGANGIKALREVAADKITASTFDGVPEIPHSNAALPIVDGYVIPQDTYSLYAAGKQARVPLLLGYNADEGAYIAPRTEPEVLWAETVFGWQMWAWARVHAETSASKVFFYHFTARQNGHGAELPYLFGHPFMREWDADDRKIASDIAGYWTAFAKRGDPNSSDLPFWPAYKLEQGHVMHLGQNPAVGEMPDVPLHTLIDAYMNGLRPQRR